MPTSTYTPLATVTLGTAVSSVSFSSIPATYRDLIVVLNVSGSADVGIRLRFNGDTGTNYTTVAMAGWSGGTLSNSYPLAYALFYNLTVGVNTNGIPAPVIGQIMDYSATDKHKTLLTRASSTNEATAMASRWANTNAITSMEIYLASGNYAVGSTFNLYGVIA
jgi:hypothetical protein